ncbi:MAG: PQQ-binding-like beta-propeller repeat protein [Balneolaceae bacterium]|nr:PQQ-binding-like beta-propeller repeat protein [Balneolaceae bacterium]
MIHPRNVIFAIILCCLTGCNAEQIPDHDSVAAWENRLNNYTDWGIYRGDQKGNQYSELSQINTGNVHQLEKAWEYKYEGEPKQPGIYSNPIIVDGLLYFNTPDMRTVALDAVTGEEVWVFDPAVHNDGRVIQSRSRGVIYWEDEDGNNQRIFNSVRDRVYALDAKTGELIEPFGQQEESKFIDLRQDLPVPRELADIEITTQGAVYREYLIIPGRQPEGNQSTPGDIRAYNALTGEFEWIFNTIPLEGQYGYDTWEFEENMHYGGANPWGGFTIDEERGWVFAATGAAAGEFIYGGSRKGENLFSSTVLALDATTGERQWHYQVIRHDIFDYDLPPAPILATITTEEGPRDVAVQLTKMGFIFVLDRDTGEPVFPVVDRPVPASNVPGEEAWPTQPVPVLPPPLVRQELYESDLTNITPESREYALEQFRRHETGPLYTPASIAGTITTPGHLGGLQWHGGAFNPETNVLFVNANEAPTIHELRPIAPDNIVADATPVQRGTNIYNSNCTACHGLNRQGNLPFFPPLSNLEKSSEELHSIIVNGVGGMPPFPQFSDEELYDLVAYLESETEEIGPSSEMISPEDYETTDGHPPTWSGGSGDWAWSTTTPQYANIAPFFVDHMGYPAISPPWGTLSAVDLSTGRIKWKIPFGEHPELVEKGIRNTGTVNMGGAVATAGGLVFIGATQDEKFRAFDQNTGQVLWEYQLPAGGYATPSVYMIDGKQYVVIAAGGGAKPQTKLGKSVIAFSLSGERIHPRSLPLTKGAPQGGELIN